jgi:peptidoglycan/LPS O-acetylase OafA/YrhL
MFKYRADIDGLRAVAIIPVVLFHAGVPGFGGGYVGVDVFFVISGFLITQLLLHDLETDHFSIANFYERRIRRIFPAIFALMAVVAVMASWLLMPQDLAAFGRSAVATSLFFSNVEFWQHAGYFARAAEEMPLLHTWSLAVEEQFYIFFPLFLRACHRGGRNRLVPLTALVAIASLALSLWTVPHDRDTAFYLAHTRAWELALGALLSMGVFAPAHSARTRHAVGLLGLGLIGFAVHFYSAATPFPGAAALLPCVGTAAIIWAGSGGHNIVGNALARRPLVLVGVISYSLYLWHWPLLVFADYVSPGATPVWATALAVSGAVIAALLSWRFVERPFRGHSGLFTRPGMFRAAGIAMTVMIAFGITAQLADGWPLRLAPDVRKLMAGRDDHAPLDAPCWNVSPQAVATGDLCRTGASTGTPSFLVWGDSHARVLSDVIGAAGERHGRSGLIASRSACAPLLDVRREDLSERRQCMEFNRSVLDFGLARPGITDVILIGRWALLTEGARYLHEHGEPVYLSDSQSKERSFAENRRVFERGLSATVARLTAAGKRVWIMGPVPEVGWDVPGTLARGARFGRTVDIAPTMAQFTARQAFVLATLDGLAGSHGATLIPVHPWLCDSKRCGVVSDDGRPLYFDTNHLSRAGAQRMAQAPEPIFAANLQNLATGPAHEQQRGN